MLRGDEHRVLFDLGYDITIGRTKDRGRAFLPPWVEPIRCIGDSPPRGYCAELVEEAWDRVVAGTSVADAKVYDGVCADLANALVATFTRENLRFLIVENGTLPDNPLFTEALYQAIEDYGSQRRLGKFVLWRDHDLMWSVEPHLYGPFPYPGVRRPTVNRHIHFAVITEWMQRRMLAWAPSNTYHVIANRFFHPSLQERPTRALRATYGIPDNALLLARCTRVIPQKSIERDLRLLDQIQMRLDASGEARKAYLFVTGPVDEDPDELERLRSIERTLSIAGQIVWGDGLLPYNTSLIDPDAPTDRFSIRDLLAEADLSTFLTSFDYEGFGNPPGEAMAMGVPFAATTYELYNEVYGKRGAVAPLLNIQRASRPDEPIPAAFVDTTLRVLTDRVYRDRVVKRNLEVCRRHFSLEALRRQVDDIFGTGRTHEPT